MPGADDRPIVVKVGGSLLRWDGLKPRLSGFLDSIDRRHVLIAGGGPVADAVRGLDAVHGLGEATSHRLALRAMDVTAHALAALVDRARVVEEMAGIADAWSLGLRPVLAPRRFLEEVDEPGADPLPLTWATTSDSIAARVAAHLGAGRLVLLKSDSTGAKTRREAAEMGHVDPVFPVASRGVGRVESVDLRDAGRPTIRLD